MSTTRQQFDTELRAVLTSVVRETLLLIHNSPTYAKAAEDIGEQVDTTALLDRMFGTGSRQYHERDEVPL